MHVSSSLRRRAGAAALALFAGGGLALLALHYRPAPTQAYAVLLAVALPAAAYIAWSAHAAGLVSGGIALALFSGNWGNVGLPELIAPDRLLIVAAIATVILRGPAMRRRAPIQVEPIHLLLVATVLYILGSAVASGTVDKPALLRLADRVGAVPFLLFALAPTMFGSRRQRSILLGCLVAVGLYLSVTAVFEVTGVTALVFPRYIADPALGIHFGRARGPFLEAVGNGTAIYIALVAAVIAAMTWTRGLPRAIAMTTIALCVVALVLTLTRSIWLGAALATAVTLIAHPGMRRWFVPVAVAATVAVSATIASVPGLADKVRARESQQSTIYDRLNLNRAAINMLAARPLFGFGWDRFKDVGTDYFEQGDYPLTAGVGVAIHNAYLAHLAELGLVGTSLWLAGIVFAIWLAVSRRGPPELDIWRLGLIAIATMNAVVSAFVYPYLFGIVVMWTWAGIVYRGNFADASGAA
jgi:putative inorganic carbon (HCO3(-)) transporter